MGCNRPVPLRITKNRAKLYFEFAYSYGEFALAPLGVPSSLWKECAREIERAYGVKCETRVDPKTDQAITRINHGYPKGIERYSPEAREWAANNPAWVATQNVWCKTNTVAWY